ncbi:LysR family transcriptional regulator [Methylobacterium fujisawaense]|uniref:LysR family transcriptional regulator n=1 Tax=Methylobacterium fujisawaense TaxID=107400 RepID=UPI002F34864A
MDLRRLRYFVALAEERHFGRAAQRLSLSQPPLSHAIRRLEDELGAILFNRTSRRVSLTPAGAALLREARAILQRTENASALVRDVASGRRGRLRVGFSGSTIYRGLPQLLDGLRKSAPDIEVELHEMNSAEQIEALRNDELSLGFVHVSALPSGLQGFRYRSEPFVSCLPRGHAALRESKSRIKLIDLQDEDFILFSRHVSPDYYESIVAICREAGFLPRVRFEVRQWLSVVALVANGGGVALVPGALTKSGPNNVIYAALPKSPILSETWCVWASNAAECSIRGPFLDVVRAYINVK